MHTKSWQWILAVPFILMCTLSYAVATDNNSVKSITTLATGDIEITVTSTRAFPVRNQLVSLRIGSKDFSRSRSPADGSLNTLIFFIPSEAFKQIASGDAMTVQYGSGNLPGDKWDFSSLDKGMLVK